MHVALVENPEDDVHDEDRSDDEERQRPEKLLEDEPLALHLAFDGRRQYFGGGFLNEVDRIAERDAGLGIETESDAGELIEVIDRLQPDVSFAISSAHESGSRVAVPSGFT